MKTEVVLGADNGLTLSEMRGLDFDDPEWEGLLDQLTAEDYQELIARAGYGNPAIDSIDKPYLVDADSATGPITADSRFNIPSVLLLAQAWDPDLAYDWQPDGVVRAGDEHPSHSLQRSQWRVLLRGPVPVRSIDHGDREGGLGEGHLHLRQALRVQ